MSFPHRMRILMWVYILNWKPEKFMINAFILGHIFHVITFRNLELMGEIQDI